MTTPTDAEIIALLGDRQFSTIGAVREALRRWGTPPAVAGEPVAHIRDVDFMKTHFVVIDSQGFQVAWREEAVLQFVGRPELQNYDAWQEETALFLKYEEDGLLFEAYLTVEELSALTWSAEKEAFLGPDGSMYTFYTEEKYRPYVPRS